MKKIWFWLGMGLAVLTGGQAAAEGPLPGYWVLGLAGGPGVPLSNISSPYQLGIAGQFTIGYQLDGHLALYVASQSTLFSTPIPDVGLTEFTLVPTVRYAFGDFMVKPYLAGGVGYNSTLVHVAGATASLSNAVAQAGLGVLYNADTKLAIFIEAKYTAVFDSATTSYLPVYFGFDFGL